MKAVNTVVMIMIMGIISFFAFPAVAAADPLVCDGAVVDTTNARALDT